MIIYEYNGFSSIMCFKSFFYIFMDTTIRIRLFYFNAIL